MRSMLTDIYGTKIKLQISNSGYVRLDFEGDSFKNTHPITGDNIPSCVSMTIPQANILLNALQDLIDMEGEG